MLVLDEVGYLPLSRAEANMVFQLVSRRYERGSIILTSKMAQVFGDDALATAILDRLHTTARSSRSTVRPTGSRIGGERKEGDTELVLRSRNSFRLLGLPQHLVGGLGPHEGLRPLVVAVDVGLDGVDEFLDVAMDAAA